MNLWQMISLKLYESDKMKQIKDICDLATKEHQVQAALDSLERSLRQVRFQT